MAEDSWALQVDVQEATTPSSQVSFTYGGHLFVASLQIKNGASGDNVDLAEQSLLNKLICHSLVKNRNQVEVLQADPSSPLFSVKTFQELRLEVTNALFASRRQNLIAQSQSGTGKTAAFSLAMLSHVNPDNKWTQCLCVAPTYELALQIGQVIEQMGKFCPNVSLAYAIRGNTMARGVKLKEQIVIGTPGTILDWCTKYKLIDPKKITMFVLDEADVMIAMQGHRDQSIRIHRLLSKSCQMLLFSATFEDSVMNFAERVIAEPNIIRLKREEETLDTIKQFYVLCRDKEDKFTALCNLYGCLTIAQAMIFCHTRKMASWLASSLIKEGHQVALLSGEMTVEQRAAVIKRFRNGNEKVLVTTNVCSRGIDVEQVSLVVNFDLPVDMEKNADNETYLHRIGRTGRFGRRGFAVNMVDSERSMDIIKQIEMHFSHATARLGVDALLVHVHQFIVQLKLDHGLHGGVLGAVLTVQEIHQDLGLAGGIFRNEAKNTPQAVEKPVEK
uniref:RNA helicase n=1 Tax=Fundulus heteroclitus TaxID=8078 RepID=A0A3Q2P3Q6_FUNHE